MENKIDKYCIVLCCVVSNTITSIVRNSGTVGLDGCIVTSWFVLTVARIPAPFISNSFHIVTFFFLLHFFFVSFGSCVCVSFAIQLICIAMAKLTHTLASASRFLFSTCKIVPFAYSQFQCDAHARSHQFSYIL